MTGVRMRDDLANEKLLVPAGASYSGYDDLHHDRDLSANELMGAQTYDDGSDPDSHAFCVVRLKNGEVVYMYSVDLDFEYDKE